MLSSGEQNFTRAVYFCPLDMSVLLRGCFCLSLPHMLTQQMMQLLHFFTFSLIAVGETSPRTSCTWSVMLSIKNLNVHTTGVLWPEFALLGQANMESSCRGRRVYSNSPQHPSYSMFLLLSNQLGRLKGEREPWDVEAYPWPDTPASPVGSEQRRADQIRVFNTFVSQSSIKKMTRHNKVHGLLFEKKKK